MGQLSIAFRKNTSQFDGRYYNFQASANYQYVEMPFELGQTPDTVIISAISSLWNNTNLMYLGSELYIDDLKFKTKLNPTMLDVLNLNVHIYPNPNAGIVHLSAMLKGLKSVRIYTVTRETLYEAKKYTSLHSITHELTNGKQTKRIL